MTPAIIAGLLAGYGIAIPVGAVGAYLVALTARTSLRVGAAAALGVATVDGAYALADLITPWTGALRWIATAVLVVMAARITVTAVRRHHSPEPEPEATSPLRAYASLVAMTLINPTTIIYFVAVILGGQATTAATWPTRTAFVLSAFTASATWQLLLAGGGALLGRTVTGPRGRLTTSLASSALIIFLAVRTACP